MTFDVVRPCPTVLRHGHLLVRWKICAALAQFLPDAIPDVANGFMKEMNPDHGLPRWLSWLRHSVHQLGRSVRGAGVQSPGRPVDFVVGIQGHML